MADVRPFRALRYNSEHADLAASIAPPYDVISPQEQAELYRRSPHNIVRIEYGEQRMTDTVIDNPYTRAAADLDRWQRTGMLTREHAPTLYVYRQQFEWDGERRVRTAYIAAVRLEEWEKGIIKPHERTLSGPKADRLELLRATRTQISPVYSLFRSRRPSAVVPELSAERLYDVEAGGQRHTVSAVYESAAFRSFAEHLKGCDVYVADGHHRYETALTYRDECRAQAGSWTGEEAENFVLMGLTEAADPGLLVLPTHRLVNPPRLPPDALPLVARQFSIEDVTAGGLDYALAALGSASPDETRFVALGLVPGKTYVLTLADRAAIETMMPAEQPQAWKTLDVNVLQFGVLGAVFGIDDAVVTAGAALTYTQDAHEAAAVVDSGGARLAFLLNATRVEQLLAVADAGARMPQKSTYFYPKLPTGLVLNPLDA